MYNRFYYSTFLIFILLNLFTCKPSKSYNKNILEKELDKIPKNTPLDSLIKIEFNNFSVDWKNPNKWESDCEVYDVIPKIDTFKNSYDLDFCYDKYRWWNKNKNN